jgi:hypothetical protein
VLGGGVDGSVDGGVEWWWAVVVVVVGCSRGLHW